MKRQILFSAWNKKKHIYRSAEIFAQHARQSFTQHATHRKSLRKHAYSNILNILTTKNEKFQIKIRIFLILLVKT